MAKCRVYLFTYQRNQLLKRAVGSLLNQTFTDWVCEVHNDMPGDDFPAQYIESLNDTRFTMVDHAVNMGTTAAFNLAFNGCAETYATMLEDDNWWEPTFLSEMIALLDQNPTINIAWSNMQVWQELTNNQWRNCNETLWPVNNDVAFHWPQPVQALGCLHSTGAMLYRGNNTYQIPDEALSNSVELIRERCFEYPIYLYSKPLANFSRTLVTSQSSDSIKWTGTQVMMLASYLAKATDQKGTFKGLLKFYRVYQPSPIPAFFLACVIYLRNWNLLLNLNLKDWLITIRWLVANVFKLGSLKDYLKSQKTTWQFLERSTPPIR